METELFFNNGRSALKAGLILLDIKEKDEVMIPEFICDSVLQPFNELKIKPIFFKVHDNLNPNWKDVNKKYTTKTKAIMMTHFFGFPNEINLFKKFKKDKNILLIEDYCHGYNGKFYGKKIGSFGDISFSSLKKILPILNSGGILKINIKLKKSQYKFLLNLKKVKFNKFFYIFYLMIKRIKKLFFTFFNMNIFRSKFENYNILKSSKKTEFILGDNRSYKIIKNFNFDREKKIRFFKYKMLQKLFKTMSVDALFEANKNVLPWYFVGKINNSRTNRDKIFYWAWKNKLNCFSWPKFPTNTENRTTNKKRWNSIICVSLKGDM